MRLTDKNLLLLSLFVSVLGVLVLIGLLLSYEEEFANIEDMVSLEEGSEVAIQARVASVTSTSSMTRLTLVQKCSVDAIIFADVNKSKGDEVILEGEIDDYGDSRNIIVSGLKVIS